ncbi:PepSY-like domain-containing protein [Maribacter sp. ACAM166]|uniref:PepSY-like domain-containing protein n=1 Tax=Maribacter sp. ACAM166 TaxID=2508996 RepID=UPI0010FD8976|nr:PepSY-like domain-containing protein [Maribacter sp. ACAM166]TLP80158.1 hypothetical protein ES765_09275 [Maribacter sp. ACAM166]
MSLSVKRLFRSRKPIANAMVLSSFNLKFPKSTHILWQQTGVFKWHVNFKHKKKKCTALFNSEGTWLETITFISWDKIPEQIQRTMEEKYTRNGLQQIYHVQTPNRSIYEINLNTSLYSLKLLYDHSGKIVGKLFL